MVPKSDAAPAPGQFVLTGSQNFLLLRSISQSPAGRAAMAQLPPLMLAVLARAKVLPDRLDDYLWQGAYPAHYKVLPARAHLAPSPPNTGRRR